MTTSALHAAVIGHPVAHSQSPALHRAAYEYLGAPISYRAVDVLPAGLADLLCSLRDPAQQWRGLSVTMPHKTAVIALVDSVDESVQRVGALNTVLREPHGRLVGFNTDVAGIAGALRHAGLRDTNKVPETADLLGAGGTGRAAVVALYELGVQHVRIHVRNPGKAASLKELAEGLGLSATILKLADVVDSQLLISTLPAHTPDHLRLRTAGGTALDVTYSPWPSALATNFQAASGHVISGLEMLLYQAVEQVRIFSGDYWPSDSARINELVDVMCSALGLPQRGSSQRSVAG